MQSVAELLSNAQADTGLDDFGDDSFREGLDRLVHSLRHEARLSTAGEAAMHGLIMRLLTQRLQVEDWYSRHPEIDDESIDEPLIALGLPRTGSTALSSLLAEDPEARSLTRWEAAEPCPPPAAVRGPDPRVGRMQAEIGGWSPHRKELIPGTPTGPAECQNLMAFDFKAIILQAFPVHVPSYSKWLLYDADFTPAYVYERRVLKLLQWGTPARPWHLKSPNHLPYLEHLNRVFPDARFVMTHRDPAEVLVSWSDLMLEVGRPFSDDIDPRYVGAVNLELWSVGIERALAFRESGAADGRFYDIDFTTMQHDPIGEIRRLYAWLGQLVTGEYEAGMTRWWQEHSAQRPPNVHPDPATFGYELGALRSMFADYTTRMARCFTRDRR